MKRAWGGGGPGGNAGGARAPGFTSALAAVAKAPSLPVAEPSAKKRSRPSSGEAEEEYREPLKDASRAKLVAAVIEELTIQGGVQGGGRLVQGLQNRGHLKPLIDEAKTALGGKGWLKKLLEGEAGIELVAELINEPTFRLTGGRYSKASLPTRPPPAKAIPADAQEICQQLVESACAALEQAELGYLAGHMLVKHLSEDMPAEVEVARKALGSNGGKGWLKALVAQTDLIEQIEVFDKGEPCYKLPGFEVEGSQAAAAPHVRAAAAPQVRNMGKGGSGGKGKALARFGREAYVGPSRPAGPAVAAMGAMGGMGGKGTDMSGMEAFGKMCMQAMMQQSMMAMGGGGMNFMSLMGGGGMDNGGSRSSMPQVNRSAKGGKNGVNSGKGGNGGAKNASAPANQRGQGPTKMTAHVQEALVVLVAAAIVAVSELMGDEGAVQGNQLSKRLVEEYPDAAQLVKEHFGGKGWVKKLVAMEPSLECVTVPGKDEPCYRLAE